MHSDEVWMREALLEARHCLRAAPHSPDLTIPNSTVDAPPDVRISDVRIPDGRIPDVPVGAVCVLNGQIIGRGHNRRELDGDPTAHAETLALRAAAQHLGNWRLRGVTLYVTLEPCTMCAGAIWLARVERVVFGAWDAKAGACGSLFDIPRDPRLNHRPQVRGGVLQNECAALLDEFFAAQRRTRNSG